VIRVVLADDQPLVRAGFRMLLDAEEDIAVVGEADNGAAALDLVRTLRPDVVLIDIRMPGVDGLEALRQITGTPLEGVRVLVLTTFELDEYVFEAVRLGASGFLVKHTQPADLVPPCGRSRPGGAAVAQRDPPADPGVRGAAGPARPHPADDGRADRPRAEVVALARRA
jgi:DNA-binding NarL/FixJ family response regulator